MYFCSKSSPFCSLLQVDFAIVAAAHGVDLAGNHRLQQRGVVVEAQDLDAGIGFGRRRQQPVLTGAARQADLLADQVGMTL